MAKRMLIDAAHPEETRVVVLNGHRLEEFDFETSTKKQIKGNIYLAKVTRVEPSLQAAFVEYGGNRHGFLAFGEIHPDYYRIPVADRQAALEEDRAAEEEANEREEQGVDLHIADVQVPSEPEHDFENGTDETGAGDEHDDAAAAGPLAESMSAEILTEALRPSEDEHEDAAPAASSLVPDPAQDAGAGSFAAEPLAAESGGEHAEAFTDDESAIETLVGEEVGIAGETGETPPPIETIGGDELEETARPRIRPHRHYKIQEVIKRRQIMLVQVTKEERGNKGAALTTYISLAGRYCVLMPNTPRGGGVSRKITSLQDRRRLKDLMSDLEVPDGMGVIVRTAGSERSRPEIKRDFEYLMRLWDEIRELTLKSTAPALIYEEGNLIKRSIRDLYASDIEEVLVDGKDGYETARSFMRMLMPSHARRVRFYNDPSVPLLNRFQVEGQLDAIHSPVVQLRSGGYIVINPTEALVAIDVNSGRSTRERNIEETALKTNLEAAEEVARQLRLRDLAGLIVIDFIDMEERRHNHAVERRIKDSMRHDRARIQLGHVSPFGLMELSRQRLRPSLLEASTQPCPHCNGTGHIRSTESTALHVLRAIEEEGMRRRTAEVTMMTPPAVALYVLNHKRTALQQIEACYGFRVTIGEDEKLVPPAFRLERVRALTPAEIAALPVPQPLPMPKEDEADLLAAGEDAIEGEEAIGGEEGARDETETGAEHAWPADETWHERNGESEETAGADERPHGAETGDGRSRRRRRRRRGGADRNRETASPQNFAATPLEHFAGEAELPFGEADQEAPGEDGMVAEDRGVAEAAIPSAENGETGEHRRRRRGRRGGRRRRRGPEGDTAPGGEHDGHGGEFAAESPMAAPEETEAALAEPSVATSARDEAEEIPPAPAYSPVPAFEAVHPAPAPREEARVPEQSPEEPVHAPVAYNVPPAHEVTGPPEKPRRGWWRR